MEILVKSVFGSRLYGLETESSDWDFKGVFLPSKRDLVLTRASTAWSEKGDNSETQLFSLQQFVKLALQGDMVALDVLHAPREMWEVESEEWEYIHSNRSKFYSRGLRGYVGYIKSQTAKYCERGGRLETCERVIDFLRSKNEDSRLSEFWGELPQLEHTKVYTDQDTKGEPHDLWDVVGRKLPSTIKCGYALEIISSFASKYGERARAARDNRGVDWKAVSHAFRACCQVIELCETGDLKFPLRDRDFLFKIKTGQYHFVNDGISEKMNNLVNEAEEALDKSPFPSKGSREFWENFIVDIYLGAKE